MTLLSSVCGMTQAPFASHLLFPQLRRETGRLGQMVTRNISSYLQQIIDLDAGRHLWKYRLHNIIYKALEEMEMP